MTETNEILQFWFGDDPDSADAVAARSQLWFQSNEVFDDAIRERFGELPDRALAGELSGWERTPRGSVALVLVLDQFPRNLHRGSAQAFAYDAAALAVTRGVLADGRDRELHPLEAVFVYLPLEHAEDRTVQELSVESFRKLAERAPSQLSERFESFVTYAERHRVVIEKFGRFPHRNAILGRDSTPAEVEYLRSGGDSF